MDYGKEKYIVLERMHELSNMIGRKLDILDALDRDTDSSDSYDIHDQVAVVKTNLEMLNRSLDRVGSVIPDYCEEMTDGNSD